jgi:glycosyltransferase involved in cell wall biosynthesis
LTHPYLSIIIPAYNEEQRLPHTLEQIIAFLQQQSYTYELLIMENGSRDATLAVAQSFAGRYPFIQAVHLDGRGKGLAVQQGMLLAQGQYRFMCDADLSMPIDQLNRFLPPHLPDGAIAIASREAKGAVRYGEPTYRHLGGRVINLMIRLLVLPGLQDTQCGFKCFPATLAGDLFRRMTLTGWSFDVEILFIARLRSCPIVEIPIPWYYQPDSKLNVFSDTWRLFKDLLNIRKKAWRGVYR